MIEKMRFVSITGPKDDIDRVTDTYLSKYEIHLENTYTELGSLKNISPFLESNPYKQLQKNTNELLEYINTDVIKKNKDYSIDEATSIIVQAYDNYLKQKEEIKSLEEKCQSLNERINLVAPFRQLNFELSDIKQFKFIKFRYGKMSHEHYNQFMKYEYENLNVLFFESNIDDDYVWGIYFTPSVFIDKVDAIFASLHFERILIPDEEDGTVEESYQKYSEELSNTQNKISELLSKIKDDIDANNVQIVSAASVINSYSHNRDIRKLAACTTNNTIISEADTTPFYILCGWMASSDAVILQKELEHDPNVFCLLEEHTHMNIQPPTKLKNPKIFKPFESFVNMYGLPNYNEIDPTIFLAISYSILFGLMFGDVGQGLLLLIGGFILYKFKGLNIAGIISLAGIFSTIFGFVYGSVFGFEDIIKPLWINPMQNVMTILFFTIGFGILLNFIAIIISIFNNIKSNDLPAVLFDTNGIAGIIFYAIVISCVVLYFLGYKLPATWLLAVCLIIPLLTIFLREPLSNLIKKKDHIIEGSKGMFFVESFFELFEILLSFLTNSLSFVRVGAFALSHAGLMSVVLMLAKVETSHPNIIVLVIGNLFVMGLEGLSVAIQVLRLQYYEMFSRYYKGNGKPFKAF